MQPSEIIDARSLAAPKLYVNVCSTVARCTSTVHHLEHMLRNLVLRKGNWYTCTDSLSARHTCMQLFARRHMSGSWCLFDLLTPCHDSLFDLMHDLMLERRVGLSCPPPTPQRERYPLGRLQAHRQTHLDYELPCTRREEPQGG